MKTYSPAELHRIMSECASNSTDSEATLKWLNSIGIDPMAWTEFVDATIVQGMALLMAINEEMAVVIGAVYSAGFEFGVRFQEERAKEIEL